MYIGALVVVAGHAGVWRVVQTTMTTVQVFSYVDGAVMDVLLTTLKPVPAMTRTDDQPTVASEDT
jgi:hypothetical protein